MTQTQEIVVFEELNARLTLDQIRDLWQDGRPMGEILIYSGLTQRQLERLAMQNKWYRTRANPGGRLANDPSPEDILARAAEVRATWSEQETERRFCGKKRQSAQIPGLTYNSRTGIFLPAEPV
jgi:hypothetical protein